MENMISDISHVEDLVGKEFVARANDALEIKFVKDSSDMKSPGSHPAFTHQIFGDSELILGYQDLKVELFYSFASMTPFCRMTYSKQLPAASSKLKRKALSDADIQPQDVLGTLSEYVPSICSNEEQFLKVLEQDKLFTPDTFKGQQLLSYSKNNKTYELYKFCFNDSFKNFHRCLQTFVLFYIDGASFIDEDDPKWQIYVTFENNHGVYSTVAYSTVYPFFAYPDHKRVRISQFLVFPPFMKQGHAAALYEGIYQDALKDPQVTSFVVEDPNDEFMVLRDLCDVRRWKKEGTDASITINTLTDKVALRFLEKSTKLGRRQIQKLCECFVRQKMTATEKLLYQRIVKKRLYKLNEEDLGAISDEMERKMELDNIYKDTMVAYDELLEKCK